VDRHRGGLDVIAIVILPEGAPLFGPTYDRHHVGKVVAVDETGSEILNRPVISVDATFTDDHGTAYRVRSYQTSSTDRAVDSNVMVHYQSAHPERAVIDGMRTHVMPWWLTPLIYAFMLAMGAAVPLWGLRGRRRALELLRHGEHCAGKVVNVQTRGSGEDQVWIATIELTVAERAERIEVRSTKEGELDVGAREPLVYDPSSTASASASGDQPRRPRAMFISSTLAATALPNASCSEADSSIS
jgi:hypothetical protein